MNTFWSPDLLFNSPLRGSVLATLLLISLPAAVAGQRSYTSWPAYGGGPEQIRYSSLDADQPLERRPASRSRGPTTPARPAASRPSRSSSTACSTRRRRSTRWWRSTPPPAQLRWKFDSGIEGRGPNRGVTYWSSGDERAIFSGQRTFLYALDARTGKPIAVVRQATAGSICAKGSAAIPATQSVLLTTPGVVYKDLLIVGGRVSEGLPASPGDIRAYDVRTGELRWTFHTIPRPGEFGYDTWPTDAWTLHRRRQQLGGHGARRGARHRLRADRIGGGRLLRRQPARRQPVRQLAAGAGRGDRASASGTSRRCSTTSGIATSRRRRAWSR